MKRRLFVLWRILSSRITGLFLIVIIIPSITIFSIFSSYGDQYTSSDVSPLTTGGQLKQSTPPLLSPLDFPSPDSIQTREVILSNRIAEMSERVKHAEMINLERKKELMVLQHRLNELERRLNHDHHSNSTTFGNNPNSYQSHLQHLVDIDHSATSIQMPSLYSFLPHLLRDDTNNNNNPSSNSDIHGNNRSFSSRTTNNNLNPLKPAFVKRSQSNPKTSPVSIVYGIPTVRRPVESYLLSTLENLVENMSPGEMNVSLIVVFIAETDPDFVSEQAQLIEESFQQHIESGLIEIVAPPVSYYPNMNETKATLGDTVERTRWRTKQNLDFAYLMMYCQPKGTYYVQLEDDILTKPLFTTKMLNFAWKQSIAKPDWMVLDFCGLGFIGKMFRSRDLSSFSLIFLMLKNDKPVDWLLSEFVRLKYCRQDKDDKECRKQLTTKWLFYRPSLFQHIGTHSSLKGKVQKLKDRNFGRLTLFKSHKGENPPASVSTTLKHYKDFSLDRAYAGETYFWGFTPSAGDVFYFNFTGKSSKVAGWTFTSLSSATGSVEFPKLDSFIIRSGNGEHPEDRIPVQSTVEILPLTDLETSASMNSLLEGKESPSPPPFIVSESNTEQQEPPNQQQQRDPPSQLLTSSSLGITTSSSGEVFPRTSDGYIVVGHFHPNGIAEGIIPPEVGPIKSMRIRISSDSQRWVIFSEVSQVFLFLYIFTCLEETF